MDSRRDFLKKAMLASGAAGISQFLPASIQKAFAIDPAPGSTFMDAEHVVFLMQENRSFDHAFGAMRGVRGFNDPRAIRLPDQRPVWMQTDARGDTYAPFRLDIKDTSITWMGSLPHAWSDQVDARNNGRYDQWLTAKAPGDSNYAHMPLTMGYYTREDIPFYYALADAFTVCDHSYCSSLTGTTPNRLFFWTGTIRAEQHADSKAHVWNSEADYDRWVDWKTFPERLEENDISWKIYQNEISVEGGFAGEEEAWLSNFTDNPIEFFSQYHVKLSRRYIDYLQKRTATLPAEIAAAEKQLQLLKSGDEKFEAAQKRVQRLKDLRTKLEHEKTVYTHEKYEQLSDLEKSIHEKAFTTNKKDPYYHQLIPLTYKDGDTERTIHIPKGDVLHQFREDVANGTLPTVSWIVAPERFSDHPGSAWFGAWYLSEVMDILTKNPEVWKKTIFVLTYDENDGYFDHLPPFVAPDPDDPYSGKTSVGIDTGVEYVTLQQERNRTGIDEKRFRQSPVGLGYRVPMVIASPWSRGGYVCSQVFDHTSSLQFLEKFLSKKTGKPITEPNISQWRRTVCGDLTAAFRPYNGESIETPEALNREVFIESIHKAKFKEPPSGFAKLSAPEIAIFRTGSANAPWRQVQEKGIRPSNALPYEINVNGYLNPDKKGFTIEFSAGRNIFGNKAAGVPFTVYAYSNHKQKGMTVASYAVLPGDSIRDEWQLQDFENGSYHIAVYAPNGFFREFKGDQDDPEGQLVCAYERVDLRTLTGDIEIRSHGQASAKQVDITDHYTGFTQTRTMPAIVKLTATHGWYDVTIRVKDNSVFSKRYAGRVETGKDSFSDPAMAV
jgi:phospholipase C